MLLSALKEDRKFMKRTLIKGLLPLMAGVAVIGSGFSIWFFNNTHVTNTQNPTLSITKLADVGTLTSPDEFKLVFDQSTAGRAALTPPVASTSPALGLHIDWEGKTNHKAVYTAIGDTDDATDDDGDKIYHKMTITLSVGATLADYFKLSFGGADYTHTSGTFTIELGRNIDEFDWDGVTFAYLTEPKDKTEYTTLKNTIAATTATVQYKVEVLSD